jgi:hypothetical protein
VETDQVTGRLAAELDEWFDSNLSTFGSDERIAQGTALLRGFAIVKKLDRLKTDGLAALGALRGRQKNKASERERIASLVQGFEFAAKLTASLHDELLDTDGETKVVRMMNEIAAALDETSCGRAAHAVLLDHPDIRVRASAGAYLLIVNLMLERVVPILRQIEEREGGTSADFTAHWALLDWELKQKACAGKQ